VTTVSVILLPGLSNSVRTEYISGTLEEGLVRSANRSLLTITHRNVTSRAFPKPCLRAAIALIWLVTSAVNPVFLYRSTAFSAQLERSTCICEAHIRRVSATLSLSGLRYDAKKSWFAGRESYGYSVVYPKLGFICTDLAERIRVGPYRLYWWFNVNA
jgi:hypothetical protein